MNVMKQQEATLVQRACAKVAGFKSLYNRLEKKIIVSGKSKSTLTNYMRCIAHLALHFNCLPSELDIEQIEDYLLMVKKRNTTSSESFFKNTVYGLRFLFRVESRDDRALKLPSIKRDNKLPVVLSRTVTFTYKDYRHKGVKKVMSLKPVEFIRRFALHILPKGFMH